MTKRGLLLCACVALAAAAVSFCAVFAFVLLALLMGFMRFWPDLGEDVGDFLRAVPVRNATSDALGLKYLDVLDTRVAGESPAKPVARAQPPARQIGGIIGPY